MVCVAHARTIIRTHARTPQTHLTRSLEVRGGQRLAIYERKHQRWGQRRVWHQRIRGVCVCVCVCTCVCIIVCVCRPLVPHRHRDTVTPSPRTTKAIYGCSQGSFFFHTHAHAHTHAFSISLFSDRDPSDLSGNQECLNDLFRFRPSSSYWTWLALTTNTTDRRIHMHRDKSTLAHTYT